MNLLNWQWLTCNWDMTEKLSYTVFVLIGLKTECSTWLSIAQKACVSFIAYLHAPAAFITKQENLGWHKTSKWKLWTLELVESIGRKDKLNIHRWKKNNVTYRVLFRAWLCYFSITFAFIAWSYSLTSY